METPRKDTVEDLKMVVHFLLDNEKTLLDTVERAFKYVTEHHSIPKQFVKLESLISAI